MVRLFLRLEGLAIFALSVWLYAIFNFNWLFFIILLLAPDISMVGYLRDKKIGALTYNMLHNYIVPVVLVIIAYYAVSQTLLSIGLILLAHVALDRTFGYGLKYPSGFRNTHLQNV